MPRRVVGKSSGSVVSQLIANIPTFQRLILMKIGVGPQAVLVKVAGRGGLLLLGLAMAGFVGESFAQFFFPSWAPRTGAITKLGIVIPVIAVAMTK